ncbi:MAG: CHAT domain-containing tetratricopeptide repeat protein [Acidobacteriota bacterium]
MLLLVGLIMAGCQPAESPPPLTSISTSPESTASAAARSEPVELDLTLGLQQPRKLPADGVQLFTLELAADHYLALTVHQHGVDVKTTVSAPVAEKAGRFEVDGPTRDRGQERVVLLTEAAGTYRLRIASASPESGSYALEIEASGPAGPRERARAAAARAFYRGDHLRREGELEAALAQYQRALEIWQQQGDPAWTAATQDQMGWCFARLADAGSSAHRRASLDAFRQAAERFHQLGDEVREGLTLHQLGNGHYAAGELELASHYYGLGLRIAQRLGDTWSEVAMRANLAKVWRVQGRVQEAQDHYRRALELSQQLEAREYVANLQNDLGTLYRWLGEWQRSRYHLEQARELWTELDHPGFLAVTLNQLAQLHLDQDQLPAALETFRRALALRRESGSQRGEASTLWRIGRIEQQMGRPEEALASCRQAKRILSDLQRPRDLANVERCLGSVYAELAQRSLARAAWQRARELYRSVGDAFGEAEAEGEIARAQLTWGELTAAQQAVERALAIAESVRGRPRENDLRMAYFATVQPLFDLGVEITTELGRADLAFGLNERARGRSLFDVSNRARGTLDPALAERERQVVQSIAVAKARWDRLGSMDVERTRAVEGQMLEQLAELDAVRGRLGAASPRALGELDLAGIQSLLDPGTLLVAFRLGAQRSHLWLVTETRFEAFELPPRQRIERAVQHAYGPLVESFHATRRAAAEIALCQLGELILSPARDLWGEMTRQPIAADGASAGRQLVIAADGALHRIPFAALPDPTAGVDCFSAPSASPLIERHALSYLPSSLALASQRQQGHRAAGSLGVAILADPVFEPTDPRLSPEARHEASRWPSEASLERLPDSRLEAEEILALLPAERGLAALDTDASKARVVGGDLADASIVHFATHGLIDDRFPELSTLTLSRYDARGEPLDGALRAYEIYGLELPAELVVLSACETALGQEVAGEGLVGLTRAFFSAGTERVMVSLWRVGDRSTRALMSTFYRELLHHQASPPAALRRAQLELRQQSDHASPFAWAGWVIQGEWRPFVVAD